MLLFLFFCTVVPLSLELSYTGKVMGFFQKQFVAKDMVKLFLASFIIVIFLVLGSFFGNVSVKILEGNSLWYASTVMLILGIKMFYDGIKMHKVKQLINPLHNKGLLILSILVGLNAFFIGLSFGLMQIQVKYIYVSLTILFAGILWGYSVGLKLKNLNPHRFEFFLGIIYIIIAIILVIKF